MTPIPSKPWTGAAPPRRILIIRLQAMGDVVITLPYVQALRRALPQGTCIDFLTREEVREIPETVGIFDRVHVIGGGRSFRKQLALTLFRLPVLLLGRYDAVIDLQNNVLSRIVRKTLRPAAWSAFDRFSPNAAGERNRRTIEALGLGPLRAQTGFSSALHAQAAAMLRERGWQPGRPLVVLNPAGAFGNRNWPLSSYVDFAQMWVRKDPSVIFLITGIDKIASKAGVLEEALGTRLINLVNQTSPALAFAVLQHARFVLSEDSGLMHMAWVSGIPTLALFGASFSDWSRPLGPHTAFFDSSDLPCGQCLQDSCMRIGAEENLCMTRISAGTVFDRAMALLAQCPA